MKRFDKNTPLRTQAQLEAYWRGLMGELGFAAPQLWILVIDGDVAIDLVQVAQVPLRPSADDLEVLPRVLADTHVPGATRAFLYARPGGPMRTPSDVGWARALSEVDPTWPVHLANDVELRVAAPDDLAPTG